MPRITSTSSSLLSICVNSVVIKQVYLGMISPAAAYDFRTEYALDTVKEGNCYIVNIPLNFK